MPDRVFTAAAHGRDRSGVSSDSAPAAAEKRRAHAPPGTGRGRREAERERERDDRYSSARSARHEMRPLERNRVRTSPSARSRYRRLWRADGPEIPTIGHGSRSRSVRRNVFVNYGIYYLQADASKSVKITVKLVYHAFRHASLDIAAFCTATLRQCRVPVSGCAGAAAAHHDSLSRQRAPSRRQGSGNHGRSGPGARRPPVFAAVGRSAVPDRGRSADGNLIRSQRAYRAERAGCVFKRGAQTVPRGTSGRLLPRGNVRTRDATSAVCRLA